MWSRGELARLARLREHGKIAPVSLRINPTSIPKTHPTSPPACVKAIRHRIRRSAPALPQAVSFRNSSHRNRFHIGSQITDVEPFVAALEKVLEFVDALAHRVHLEHLDLGGGLGIRYRDEVPQL